MGKNNKKKRYEKHHHIMKHNHVVVATTTSSTSKKKMGKNARKKLAQRMKQNNYDASSASWCCRHCQSARFSTYSLVALHENICTAARSSSRRRRMHVRSDDNMDTTGSGVLDRSDEEHADNGAVSPTIDEELDNHPPEDTVDQQQEQEYEKGDYGWEENGECQTEHFNPTTSCQKLIHENATQDVKSGVESQAETNFNKNDGSDDESKGYNSKNASDMNVNRFDVNSQSNISNDTNTSSQHVDGVPGEMVWARDGDHEGAVEHAAEHLAFLIDKKSDYDTTVWVKWASTGGIAQIPKSCLVLSGLAPRRSKQRQISYSDARRKTSSSGSCEKQEKVESSPCTSQAYKTKTRKRTRHVIGLNDCISPPNDGKGAISDNEIVASKSKSKTSHGSVTRTQRQGRVPSTTDISQRAAMIGRERNQNQSSATEVRSKAAKLGWERRNKKLMAESARSLCPGLSIKELYVSSVTVGGSAIAKNLSCVLLRTIYMSIMRRETPHSESERAQFCSPRTLVVVPPTTTASAGQAINTSSLDETKNGNVIQREDRQTVQSFIQPKEEPISQPPIMTSGYDGEYRVSSAGSSPILPMVAESSRDVAAISGKNFIPDFCPSSLVAPTTTSAAVASTVTTSDASHNPESNAIIWARESEHEGAEEHLAFLLGDKEGNEPNTVWVKWASTGGIAQIPKSCISSSELAPRRSKQGKISYRYCRSKIQVNADSSTPSICKVDSAVGEKNHHSDLNKLAPDVVASLCNSTALDPIYDAETDEECNGSEELHNTDNENDSTDTTNNPDHAASSMKLRDLDSTKAAGNASKQGLPLPKSIKRKLLLNGLRGFYCSGSKYYSRIVHKCKGHNLGQFKLACDAALAYDEASILLKGAETTFNFATIQDYISLRSKEVEILGVSFDMAKSLKEISYRIQQVARAAGLTKKGVMPTRVANWVQCESCCKWRKVPLYVHTNSLPRNFFCKDNVWNPQAQTCDAAEDKWCMEDAPIKFATNEDDFQMGAWFDVRRKSERGYREAKVIDVDFMSNLKKVKFHFWHLRKDEDEWIEISSPRVAPHYSYTPRPPKKALKNRKRTANHKGAGIHTRGIVPHKKSCEKKSLMKFTTGGVRRERKLLKYNPARSGSAKNTETKDPEDECGAMPSDTNCQTTVASNPVRNLPPVASTCSGLTNAVVNPINYLKRWVSENADSPFPTASQRASIITDTGLSGKQVDDWMARARKKLKIASLRV